MRKESNSGGAWLRKTPPVPFPVGQAPISWAFMRIDSVGCAARDHPPPVSSTILCALRGCVSLGEFRMRTKMFLIASALDNWIVKLSTRFHRSTKTERVANDIDKIALHRFPSPLITLSFPRDLPQIYPTHTPASDLQKQLPLPVHGKAVESHGLFFRIFRRQVPGCESGDIKVDIGSPSDTESHPRSGSDLLSTKT